MTTYKLNEISKFQKALKEEITKNGYCVITLKLNDNSQATITFHKLSSYHIGLYEKEALLSFTDNCFSISIWFNEIVINN